MSSTPSTLRSGKGHRDENFPVASRLIAPRHRGADSRVLRIRAHRRRHRRPCRRSSRTRSSRCSTASKQACSASTTSNCRGRCAARGVARAEPVAAPCPGSLDCVPDGCDQAALSRLGRPDELLHLLGHAGRALRARCARRGSRRPGRPTTRCARRCRSSIICRTARPTTATSTASMCRSMRSAATGASVEDLGHESSSPALRHCLHNLAARTGGLLDESAPFSARIRDFRLALEVVGHPHAGAASGGDARRARSAERARASEDKRASPALGIARHVARGAPAGFGACCRRPTRTRVMREARVDATDPAQSTNASQRASGSSFYTAMRILPRAQREAMFEIYSFCRARRRHRRFEPRRAPQRLAELARMARRDQRAL